MIESYNRMQNKEQHNIIFGNLVADRPIDDA